MAGRRTRKQRAEEAEIRALMKNPWLIAMVVSVLLLCAIFYWIPQWKAQQMPAANPADARYGLTVHMIDVGQGDATLIRQGSAAMLIDAGTADSRDALIAYLKKQGIERLDIVIATHAHTDHIGGMTQVLKTFPVDTFIMRSMPEGFTPTTATYERMLTTLADKHIPVKEAAVGDTYRLGDTTVRIVGPTRDFEDMNNQSVVCLVTYGSRRFLFTADAKADSEQAMLASGQDLSADVLKVAHHGSASSTIKKFLQAVNPSIALISCGKDNDYGHPHQETLQKLKKQKAAVYRTDRQGTVVVHTDGNSLTVTTEK